MIDKNPHVLVIPSWYPREEKSLSGIFFREQSQALQRAGCQVGIIYPQLGSISSLWKTVKGFTWSIGGVDDSGVMTYRLYGWRRGLKLICGSKGYLQSVIDRLFLHYVSRHGKPDIIHAHSALMGGYLAAFLKHKYNIPYVVTEHSSAIAKGNLSLIEKQFVEDVYTNADAVIVVSPQLGDLLNKHYNNAAKNCKWVPNMVEERRFVKNANSTSPQKTGGKIVFLNVSMLKDGKGHSELLKAFCAAFSGREDIVLKIGGDGDKRSDLEELSNSLGISGQVRFLGKLNRDQVFQEMRDANVVVFPSHFETFGVVLIEALASGTPIIATKCNGPECICTPENGLLVSPRDVEELSEAMRVMALQYQNYGKRNLVEECREKFGEKNIVRKLLDVYKDILRAKIYCSVEKETDTVPS